jgi:dienelactone hydrolase
LARRLVGEHGFFALSIDGPVHGRRQVGAGGREAFWPEWAREGSVEDMTADWKAALDAVRSLPEVGGGTVGYWGLSMGTIFGAPLVGAEPRISVAVIGLMGMSGPEHYQTRLHKAAEAIACPVLFILQLEDELFSRQECLALFDALSSGDKRLHANPGLHPEVPVEELRHSIDFLVSRLTGGEGERHSAFQIST